MSRALDNWILKEPKIDKWNRLTEGPIFISTIILSNKNDETYDENENLTTEGYATVSIRIADLAGNELFTMEPGVSVSPGSSERWNGDSLPIKKGQVIEVMVDTSNVQVFMSGLEMLRSGRAASSSRE